MTYLSIEAEVSTIVYQGAEHEVISVEVNGHRLYFSAYNGYEFTEDQVQQLTKAPVSFLSLEVQPPKREQFQGE